MKSMDAPLFHARILPMWILNGFLWLGIAVALSLFNALPRIDLTLLCMLWLCFVWLVGPAILRPVLPRRAVTVSNAALHIGHRTLPAHTIRTFVDDPLRRKMVVQLRGLKGGFSLYADRPNDDGLSARLEEWAHTHTIHWRHRIKWWQ